MSNFVTIDTFPAFLRFWKDHRSAGPMDQLTAWKEEYLRSWPELYGKQVDSYSESGVDWRAVARRRVFPNLRSRIRAMASARRRLLQAIPRAIDRYRTEFGLDFSITFVIHVGIGCGAGWATRFGGNPAVLFGIENAAEVGWTDPKTVAALVEHEIAHLLHDHWRRRAGQGSLEDHWGAWWQLYTEGFATRCELKRGSLGLHHARQAGEQWLSWCTTNRSRLASLFLRSVGHPMRIRRFFGSWYPLEGHIETGYFLGSEVIRAWERSESLRAIGQWEIARVRHRARLALQSMAAG